MTPTRLCAALLLTTSAAAALAADPVYLTLDHSTENLMDRVTAQAMWKEVLPARLFKLYPAKKWGFVSEVEGGFDESRVCVVTARAMMLPRSGKNLIFVPERTATAFGSKPGATLEQCKALANVKLKEAIVAVRASLLPN